MIRLVAPTGFSLDAVVASHGWYQLAPFSFDPVRRTLATSIRTAPGRAIDAVIASGPRGLSIATAGRTPSARDRAAVAAAARRMLHLDADLSGFHRVCRAEPHLRWIARRGLGRLLRAQDLYEDAFKTLLTTNCTWTQTVAMVGRLVAALGPASASGARAFPGPNAVLSAGRRVLDRDVRVGYRTRAALELCERARAGELDGIDPADEDAARRTIRSWFGFGDYAATSLLALLGRRTRPVVDSWALARASEIHFGGRLCAQKDVERVYARHGEWAGMVAWFDLNRAHYVEWPPTFGLKPERERPPGATRSAPRPSTAGRRGPPPSTSSPRRRTRKG